MCVSAYHPYITKGAAQQDRPNAYGHDPGAQQPSQIFLTGVKAKPQHRELRALLITNSVWVI